MDLRNLIRSIDVQRLSGVTGILGIDLTEMSARVVELKRTGNPFTKFSPRFKVGANFTCRFPGSATSEEKGTVLREELHEQYVETKFAVATIRTPAVKIVTTTIPDTVEDSEVWIRENAQKLLRLPVRFDDISFQAEPIEQSEAGLIVEITFVRSSEVDHCISVCKAAGLELLAVGAGARDVATAYLASQAAAADATLIHLGRESAFSVEIRGGKRSATRTHLLVEDGTSGSSIREVIEAVCPVDRKRSDSRLVFAGHAADAATFGDAEPLRPFGLKTEYALASGLAVKGFLPELSPANFLPREDQLRVLTKRFRSITQRVVLCLGALAILLLGVPLLASVYYHLRLEDMEKKLTASRPMVSEVARLEKEVSSLEARLEGGPASLVRTNSARVLHDVAAAVPRGIRLSKAALSTDAAGAGKVTLTGYARSGDVIAELLRALDGLQICSDPELVSSGRPEALAVGSADVPPKNGYVHFVITVGVKM